MALATGWSMREVRAHTLADINALTRAMKRRERAMKKRQLHKDSARQGRPV